MLRMRNIETFLQDNGIDDKTVHTRNKLGGTVNESLSEVLENFMNYMNFGSIMLYQVINELTKNGIETSNCFDTKNGKHYVDLKTMAKSHLYLYEDGIIVGRYNYKNKIDLTKDVSEIVVDLCNEFNEALHGRDYGQDNWFDLCRTNNINIKSYM